MRKKITEYIDMDINKELWVCNRCEYEIASAHDSYKKGLLLYERNPRDIHQPLIEGEYSFAPDPEWASIIEFYCPGCGTMVETETLAVGHPLTHDIDIKVEDVKKRMEEQTIKAQD